MWPVWAIITATVGCLALVRGDRNRAEMGFVILAGLIAMQGVKEVFTPHYWWIASCLLWVSCGGVVAGGRRQLSGARVLVALLLVASGACYAAGYAAGQEFGMGSQALFGADMFGLAALISMGGPILVGFFRDFFRGEWGRGNGLASHFLRGISSAETREAAI